MKKNYLILLLLSSFIGFSQIPAGYYDTATGTRYVLKTQLYNIIKGHIDRGYDGLYVTYQVSDKDNYYENDGTVLDMYSERPTSVDPYNFSLDATQRCGNYNIEGDCYNREHIVPQSVFNEDPPMVSDAHHIPPTDGKVNGYRSNFPHGMVGILDTPPASISNPTLNGSKLGFGLNSGYSAGYTGTVFEPIDEFKGDIARMYLYFATRYENVVAGYNYDMFNHTSNQVFTNTFKSILLAWHNQDPVSQREIDRNNAIYARQNNRNPYIDHPEWVDLVWGCPADIIPPTAASGLIVTGTTTTSVSLSWTAATDNTEVTDYDIYVNGLNTTTTGNTTYTITGLTASTTYNFYVIAKDCQGNASPVSNNVNGTTNAAGGPCSTTVSENFENIPANSSAYAINNWTNGGISWSATDSRTDQTINTRAITIRNGSLTASSFADGIGSLTVTTQLKFAGSSGTFSLKVNGVSKATIPYSSTVTTTTISNINTAGPVIISFDTNSTTTNRVAFDDLSWTCYSALGIESFTENDFNIYPNPSNGRFNIEFNNTNENYSVEISSLLGQKVFEILNTSSSSISVSNLQQGIYLIKVTKDSKSIVKKIVIN